MDPYDDIADLNPSKFEWQIKVKVLNVWTVKSSNGRLSMYLILADGKNKRIEAKIKHGVMQLFDSSFEIGDWKSIHRFRLKVVRGGYYRTTKHPYRIIMQDSTIVNPIPRVDYYSASDVCYTVFDVDFNDVINDKLNSTYLIDLVGFVVFVGDFHFFDQTRQIEEYASVNFEIKNTRNDILECTAYGEVAVKFYEQVKDVNLEGMVCVLRWWRIQNEGDAMRIHSVGRCSRLDINPDMPEVQEFLDMLPIDDELESTAHCGVDGVEDSTSSY